MKILVINTGSSSIKYQLFDLSLDRALIVGVVERIGEDTGRLRHTRIADDGSSLVKEDTRPVADHVQGLSLIAGLLTDPAYGAVQSKKEIMAVGHRVVHGGESFQSSTSIDEQVLEAVRTNIPLAPLHNPPNLKGIEVARSMFPEAAQVAVFDTAFHQTLPPKAFLYALPYSLYSRHRIRRYGFHGTSHAYVTVEAAKFLNRPRERLNAVTLHLGNGASAAAVRSGRSVDTSMGLTPLEGLVMGTRSGDVDPALPFFLAENLNMDLKAIDGLLNSESGMKGLCGLNDMREIEDRAGSGDERARTALEVYAYRIKKYIGAYMAVLGRTDALIFTAGIGENSPLIRFMCCSGLETLGIRLDEHKNREGGEGIRDIGADDSSVRVLVVPTNEEKRIARETARVIGALR